MESNVAMPNNEPPYISVMYCGECGHQPVKEATFTRSSLPHECPECSEHALKPLLPHWPDQ